MDEIESKSEAEEVNKLEAIIDRLVDPDIKLPTEAIEAARENRDAITPLLIRLIEDATRNCRQGLNVEDNGHFYATYILAEFGATEAWPAVLAAISLPGEKPFGLFGDAITEDLGFILASLVGDRCDALDALIADPRINLYVRWQAVDTLLYQIRDGCMTRDSVVEKLTAHLQKAFQDGDEVAEGIIIRLESLGAKSALPLIETAFNSGLVDPQMATLESVKRDIARGDEAFQQTMNELHRPTDVIAYLSKWAAFQDHEDRDQHSSESESFGPQDSHIDSAGFLSENETTIRSAGTKVGRNEKCPCGSGKKHKKCCGRN
ncbi:DUF1186 domain-containing protein [Allorhodopirellula solitaria]|uniref:Preprotein translocase subunit SecA n=1 Tax=Allorhodopirellula solitaria TaxID=2527987 RepID=A0A5C5XZ64_9BACT|nr:DUF1186 domain-containing protein [Allorhodopirellula solitaria]TWT67573.1 hypothetical protein CA85_24260 [Allorhodopirellula solitaria]